jgi:hypothetical protein
MNFKDVLRLVPRLRRRSKPDTLVVMARPDTRSSDTARVAADAAVEHLTVHTKLRRASLVRA